MAAADDADGGGSKRIVVAVVTAIVAILAVAIVVRIPVLKTGGWAALATAALFLYVPLPFIWKSADPARYGLTWGKGARGLAETLLVAIAALVPFYTIFFLIFEPSNWAAALPAHAWRLILIQLLLISLPEEFFFRGWLQTELDDRWGRRWKLVGAEIGPGLIATAALFAIAHVAAQPTLFRALVFFPGLLFGWLRARTSSVAYPIILHTLCNLTFIAAQRIAAY